MDHLPLAILGVHATVKIDLNCSPAELVFKMTLHLPGQLVIKIATKNINFTSFVDQLQFKMSQLIHIQTKRMIETFATFSLYRMHSSTCSRYSVLKHPI